MHHVGIANPWWRGKRSQHSRRMRNPQFYVSGKRPIVQMPVKHPQIILANPSQESTRKDYVKCQTKAQQTLCTLWGYMFIWNMWIRTNQTNDCKVIAMQIITTAAKLLPNICSQYLVLFISLVVLHNVLKSVNSGESDGWISVQVGHFAIVNRYSHLR